MVGRFLAIKFNWIGNQIFTKMH